MDRLWYYTKRGSTEKFGPFTDAELVQFIKQEILCKDDYIWMPDLKNWLEISNSIYAIYCLTTCLYSRKREYKKRGTYTKHLSNTLIND